jgi:hypothetical protein
VTRERLASVRCSDAKAVDLAGGRVLAPGEDADRVDLRDPHNRALADEGRIVELDDSEPKTPNNLAAVEEAKKA